MYRLPRVQGIARRLPSMENDIRHVTAFLSLAITIRLGPTDVILDKQSAYEPFLPPRFSSRFRHFANFARTPQEIDSLEEE